MIISSMYHDAVFLLSHHIVLTQPNIIYLNQFIQKVTSPTHLYTCGANIHMHQLKYPISILISRKMPKTPYHPRISPRPSSIVTQPVLYTSTPALARNCPMQLASCAKCILRLTRRTRPSISREDWLALLYGAPASRGWLRGSASVSTWIRAFMHYIKLSTGSVIAEHGGRLFIVHRPLFM